MVLGGHLTGKSARVPRFSTDASGSPGEWGKDSWMCSAVQLSNLTAESHESRRISFNVQWRVRKVRMIMNQGYRISRRTDEIVG